MVSVLHSWGLRLVVLQPAFDKILLVPGREITTFYGHANVFGLTDFIDFRMTSPSYEAAGNWMSAED